MARLMPRGVRAMLLLLILTILVPLLLVQAGIYLSWFQTRRHAELNANLEFGRAVASNFDSYVRDILSQEMAISLAFTTPGHSPAGLNRLLVESRNQYPSLEAFSLVSPDGQIISSSSPESIGTDVGNRPYFKELLGGKDWVLSDLFMRRHRRAAGPGGGQGVKGFHRGLARSRGSVNRSQPPGSNSGSQTRRGRLHFTGGPAGMAGLSLPGDTGELGSSELGAARSHLRSSAGRRGGRISRLPAG